MWLVQRSSWRWIVREAAISKEVTQFSVHRNSGERNGILGTWLISGLCTDLLSNIYIQWYFYYLKKWVNEAAMTNCMTWWFRWHACHSYSDACALVSSWCQNNTCGFIRFKIFVGRILILLAPCDEVQEFGAGIEPSYLTHDCSSQFPSFLLFMQLSCKQYCLMVWLDPQLLTYFISNKFTSFVFQ